MRFTVWRKTWLRGEGNDVSWLLRHDNKRCCLGHLARDCGIADSEIAHKSTPAGVATSRWPAFLLLAFTKANSHACSDLMEINDDMSMSDQDREAKLTEIFAANGVEVEFKDGAGP